MSRRFRFGAQVNRPTAGLSWGESARKLEDLGYSTLLLPDHFDDQLSAAPALAAAAEATTTLRLGALVFGNDYRHPVVLAKDMATVDVLSGGRMELGLGAGWMSSDYEMAGLAYDAPGVRIERMLESIEIIRGLFGDGPVDFSGEHYTIRGLEGLPKPVQSPPPLLIGGGGRRMLTIAAQQAEIVGVGGNLRAGEIGPDVVADVTADRFDEKLSWVRDAAGERFDDLELNVLVLSTQVTNDREVALAATAAFFGLDTDMAGETPLVLVGSADEIAEQLQARRERWGLSYVVVQGFKPAVALAPVVADLAGT